ncbi:hypothetical protein JXC34_05330 [Candidatus Woesearchaeota archaeon]|nr:hypothetical protein [Candidatus Woesearchaeota archaeon]
MKRILNWIEEEKITLMIILLSVGILFGYVAHWELLGLYIILSVLVLSVLNIGHKLFLKIIKR